MNLNQLKIFYTAAKRGNLSLAAEDLFITQPAITKGIQRLQEYYDIKLFNRFGKKLVMTDAGEALFQIAEKIFEMERYAEENIREFQQYKKGHIRILASESFGAYYFPSIMAPFCRLNPFIKISVNILPSEQVVESVVELKNDLGFISYPIRNPKIVLTEILQERLVLVVPPGHPFVNKYPLDPRELESQSMIVHEKGSAPRQVLEKFIRKNKIALSSPLELSSNRAVKKAVEDGLGIALVSRKVADEEIRDGRLIEIALSDTSLTRKFYMVHHRDKFLSEPLKNLIQRIETWAAAYMKKIFEADWIHYPSHYTNP